MARRDDREYRAIFEEGATQPAPGSPTRQPRWGGEGMHRRPNAAGLLPRAAKPPCDTNGMIEQVSEAGRGSSEGHRRIVVLLVDDQRLVGAAVGQLLAAEPDIELHCCHQASDAIAMANRIVPTMVLQDLVMPDIDGLTLVRLFRENPQTKGTPVIVLSGNDD